MSSRQELNLQQTQTLRLTQQQLRFARMLEMDSAEIREAVENELEANPALEKDEVESSAETGTKEKPAEWYEAAGRGGYVSDEPSAGPADAEWSLADSLREQAGQLEVSVNVRRAVDYLIDSMDLNGYIYRPADRLRDDMEFQEGIRVSEAEMEEAVACVRQFEPAGVGATDLRDCLLLQLRRRQESEERNLAIRILEDHYDLFVKMHFDRLAPVLKAGKEKTDRAVAMIRRLNPKPGGAVGLTAAEMANSVTPDFVVSYAEGEGGGLVLALSNSVPELRVSKSFEDAVKGLKGNDNTRRDPYVMAGYREARGFMELLRQRQSTLMRVMGAIMKLQRQYFETEDVYQLRPMIIKDIAAETGLDISVISRVTANKRVETPWGVFPLRFFFSDSVGGGAGSEEGEDVLTNRKIEAEIRTLVEKEDKRHPLSDEKLREAIAARGYDVSRRTVAKYRDRLGIPVARLRKH